MPKGKYKPYPKYRCDGCHKWIYRGGVHTRMGSHYHKACWAKEMHKR
jgi:hypothetical protein